MPPPPAASAPARPVRSRAAVAAKASADKKAAAAIISGIGSPNSESRASIAPNSPAPPPKPAPGTLQQALPALPPGVPDDHRNLYQQLKDELDAYEQHSVLGAGTLTKAKIAFEQYVIGQWRKGDGLGSTALTLNSVDAALEDIGVTMSPHEIKDLVFTVAQSQEVLHHNAKVAMAAANGGVNIAATGNTASMLRSTRSDVVPVAPTPSGTSTASGAHHAGAKAAGDGMNFAIFVEVLTMTLSDCNYRDEMRLLWHDLDADGDDVLSHEDITHALRNACLRDGTLQLTAQQVQELLAELDVDSDGSVTLADFLAATNSN